MYTNKYVCVYIYIYIHIQYASRITAALLCSGSWVWHSMFAFCARILHDRVAQLWIKFKLGPTGAQLAQLGSKWAQLAPTWPQLAPNLAQLGSNKAST